MIFLLSSSIHTKCCSNSTRDSSWEVAQILHAVRYWGGGILANYFNWVYAAPAIIPPNNEGVFWKHERMCLLTLFESCSGIQEWGTKSPKLITAVILTNSKSYASIGYTKKIIEVLKNMAPTEISMSGSTGLG